MLFLAVLRLLPPPLVDFDADFLPVDLVADFLPVDLEAVLRGADFRAADLDADFFVPFLAALVLPPPADFDPLSGTLAPLSRASDKPIAIACFLDVTFFPLRPLFNLPCFISCMASSTFLPAPFEYLAMVIVFELEDIKTIIKIILLPMVDSIV